jgi:hypothetical protein
MRTVLQGYEGEIGQKRKKEREGKLWEGERKGE